MGCDIVVGPEDQEEPDEAHYFGSAANASAILKWMGSVPADEFPLVAEFGRDGRTEDPPAFTAQLDAAMEAHPPDALVEELLFDLLDVTDGLPEGVLVRIE